MPELFITPVGYKTKKTTLLISSILGITLIGAIIWGGGITFMNYRGDGGLPPVSSTPAQVSITSPR